MISGGCETVGVSGLGSAGIALDKQALYPIGRRARRITSDRAGIANLRKI